MNQPAAVRRRGITIAAVALAIAAIAAATIGLGSNGRTVAPQNDPARPGGPVGAPGVNNGVGAEGSAAAGPPMVSLMAAG